MPVSSSNSVKIKSVSPVLVIDALKKWISELRLNNKNLISAGYFGSYAKGNYAPGSDIDILLILTNSKHDRFFDRSPEFYPESFPIGMDIFVYTVDEISQMFEYGNGWIKQVFNSTIWIFQYPDIINI
ncbi:MAG: hypothetical protein A2161_09405 [Candidatus Schekmanbacteria bacterium RBG_13_48_7]|uniref:Polymerase nucleotidyl transferase domain-containing protein n=1 Tax=Candidatus Schekmanbacteria bacterium RBG_13_48_7 TaxID=1817878 RepID=A0A1F7RZV8_9BACT|nr:MAG: hypothetical protein A2161_09405 [Candidatus Schekmanbacteria bacterium RBG_13_48_7]